MRFRGVGLGLADLYRITQKSPLSQFLYFGGCQFAFRRLKLSSLGCFTILTEMMADKFNFLRPEIKNYKAEADADLITIQGQLELHDRCRCGVLVSRCFCAPSVADLILGVEELELHYRRRGRSNFPKIKKATISVRMVPLPHGLAPSETMV